jgi:hypothetical protein
MHAAVAVAAKFGVAVAEGVTVITLITGVVSGAQVGQIGGAIEVAGQRSSTENWGHPSPGRFRNPNHQSPNPTKKLKSRPSRNPSKMPRLKDLRRGGGLPSMFGLESEIGKSSIERLPSVPPQQQRSGQRLNQPRWMYCGQAGSAGC